MLVKVTLDEKELGELSPKAKMNSTLAKYTEDAGDVKVFSTADGSKNYLRVCETIPPAEGKSGPAKYNFTFYRITPPGASTAATPAALVK